MAGNRRKNKCKRGMGERSKAQPWFINHVKRQRRRNKIARKSRQVNRRRAG